MSSAASFVLSWSAERQNSLSLVDVAAGCDDHWLVRSSVSSAFTLAWSFVEHLTADPHCGRVIDELSNRPNLDLPLGSQFLMLVHRCNNVDENWFDGGVWQCSATSSDSAEVLRSLEFGRCYRLLLKLIAHAHAPLREVIWTIAPPGVTDSWF